MLRVDALGCMYGGVRALHDVSFGVETGTICGLIGPNGAGKTTLINIVSGLQHPTRGSVYLDEHDITSLAAHRVAAGGMARTFQNIRLFGDLSVLDNVLVGRHLHRRDTLLGALLGLPGARHAARTHRAIAQGILEHLHIASLADAPAASLSYGDQRRVEIARALAQEPRLLLLDEPAAGMNATETDLLAELLLQLRAGGLTLLVIEHDMDLIMRVSDQVVVLNFGEMIAAGTAEQIQRDPAVVAAYLGEDDALVGVTS